MNIWLIGNFDKPDANAPGRYVYATAKAIRAGGHSVSMLGYARGESGAKSIEETRCQYDGIDYYSITEDLQKSRLATGKMLREVSHFLESLDNTPDVVILFGSLGTAGFLLRFQNYLGAKGCVLIGLLCDWLPAHDNNKVRQLLRWIDTSLKMRVAFCRCDGLMVISSYLQHQYSNMKTLVFPSILDLDGRDVSFGPRSDITRIIYAGDPFHSNRSYCTSDDLKDRIDVAVDLVLEAGESGVACVFDVFGLTKEDYLKAFPSYLEKLGNNRAPVVFHGRQPMDVVHEALQEADYLLLVRDDNRCSNAGFPTKVAESITSGTPVITTKTSDIASYLDEGSEVHFIEPSTQRVNTARFVSILNKPAEERMRQKEACAHNVSFDYRTYASAIQAFLTQLLNDMRRSEAIGRPQ